MNDYEIAVLEKPLQLTKPVSLYTAAYFGSKIGGIAVGIVAAQNAIAKESAYRQNVEDVIDADLRTGNG